MNKYQNTLQIDISRRIPYYYSALPAKISMEEVPFYYITKQGDRLDTLSQLFYQTPRKWWMIAKANNLVNGTVAVPEGTNLYIPSDV